MPYVTMKYTNLLKTLWSRLETNYTITQQSLPSLPHSTIGTVFKESLQPSDDKIDKYDWKLQGRRFKWYTKKQNEFKSALLNSKKVNGLDEISQRVEGELIHSTGEMVQALFLNASKSALARKKEDDRIGDPKKPQKWEKTKKN